MTHPAENDAAVCPIHYTPADPYCRECFNDVERVSFRPEVTMLDACPDCPWCGHPPIMRFYRQAFCGNAACQCVTWNPTVTQAQNLADPGVIDLSFLDPRIIPPGGDHA